MKKRLLFLSLVPFVFLAGCAISSDDQKETAIEDHQNESVPANDQKSEPNSTNTELDLAEGLMVYLEDISVLAPEETRIIGLYDSVTGVNYTDDETLYYTLMDEVIPGYREFVVELEAIMPQNAQIRDLHELYIEAANMQYNSFTLMISALEEQNMDTMTQANQGLEQARKLLRDWLYEVEAISSETGVDL
jgi:hypothetical protein